MIPRSCRERGQRGEGCERERRKEREGELGKGEGGRERERQKEKKLRVDGGELGVLGEDGKGRPRERPVHACRNKN